MGRPVVINGRELNMNAGFIEPNSEWSVTVGEDGSVEVNRIDLKEENDQLKQEIAELRRKFELDMFRGAGEIESYKREASAAVKHAARAESENAKLRKLVRDITEAFIHGNCYRWCEAEPCNFITDGRCQFLDRMRELGVEP